MATKTYNISDIGEVSFYKRRGNRSIRISMGTKGDVRVSLPYWVPYKAAQQFVLSKKTWILANQIEPTILLKHGDAIGKAHRLYFEEDHSRTKIQTRVIQNEIRIYHQHNTTHPAVQQAAQKAGLRALKKEAQSLLPQRLRTLAQQYDFRYRDTHVKPMKSRWGSCSSQKDITLNIFLMQLPWHLIDYVLVHELTHTKVMQHGEPFWSEMQKHLPKAKQLRKEIAIYKTTLSPRAAHMS